MSNKKSRFFMVIEHMFGSVAAGLYRRGYGRVARKFDLISWAAYDRCPSGYKGKF